MITINKKSPPKYLNQLNANPSSTYEDLKDDCAIEVRSSLRQEQRNLCAYCQRSIKEVMTIEHYIPQSAGLDGQRNQLNYNNLLGVCSGNYYIDKHTNEKIVFCESKRGNQPLTINPLSKSDMDTIHYNSDNKICSSNNVFQQELDEILYLNFEELCEERFKSFERFRRNVQSSALKIKLSPTQAYRKAIRLIKNNNPEYSGFLLYKFERLLKYHSNPNQT